eukprot:1185608-Prorocentrum_minimum.AAC.2
MTNLAESAGISWEWEVTDWLSFLPPSNARTIVEPTFPADDELPGGWMTVRLENADKTSSNSSSLLRRPTGNAQDFVRGNVANSPFSPGGEESRRMADAAASREVLGRKARTEWLPEVSPVCVV